MSLQHVLKDLKKPGKEYRGKPFWSWNGELKQQELRDQIKTMKEMGLGGFFMHSRTGLTTTYLGEEWFDGVAACVEEAKKNDMEAWLYDEDRWPSGFAGGYVTKKVSNRLGYLFFQEAKSLKAFQWTSQSIALFKCKNVRGVYQNIQRLSKKDYKRESKDADCFLYFYYDKNPPSTNFNGYTYVDTMNEEAIKDFLDVTHEAYKKRFGKEFGKVIPGIFTDEPYFGAAAYNKTDLINKMGPVTGKFWWTPKLPQVFKEKFNYDILDHLPAIFLNTKEDRILQSRWHYFETLTSMFVKAYSKQIHKWCNNNKLQYTGHMLEEPTLMRQTIRVGSAMRSYEYMHAPGMDSLTEYWREYDTAKQVSSVARQFGNKWRLTETYGCTGWDFNFKGQKAIGDWQAVLGINLRCQHLSWYTMEGEAKRDYPASILHQSPWWQDYAKVEDYFARVHLIMTQGQEVRDVLLVHPIESMWAVYKGARDETTENLDADFRSMTDYLLRNHLDFDYGDEDIILRHAKVAVENKKPVFVIGKAKYQSIVVPPMYTIRASTLKIISQFIEAGGNVIFFGDAPDYVDCVKSTKAKELSTKGQLVNKDFNANFPAFEESRRIAIQTPNNKEAPAVLYLWREDTDNHYLFVVNTGQVIEGKNFVAVKEKKISYPKLNIIGFENCLGTPFELDLESGLPKTVSAKIKNGKWELNTSLDELGSKIFVYPKKKTNAVKTIKAKDLIVKRQQVIKQKDFKYQLSECNNLVLDKAIPVINKENKKLQMDILDIDHLIHDTAGWKRRAGNMIQPWANKSTASSKEVDVHLTYQFSIGNIPSSEISLALENPQAYTITINGNTISNHLEHGWWVDKSLKVLQFDNSILKVGQNEITLHTKYTENFSGLEIIYLLGHFGVQHDNKRTEICSLPITLKLGDWVKQKLPFYSGHVNYLCETNISKKNQERVFLRIPDFNGTAVKVFVNDNNAGTIAWNPKEIDITNFLNGSKTNIRIQVLGHRRNSHGPFHGGKQWFEWTGPSQFLHKDNEYQLVPCGLLKAPEILYKR
jgi:hypothetical protein